MRMKRILLAPILLFLLAGCQGKPKQWPTSWREFDTPYLTDESKPYVTVKFLNSTEEACKEYENASKLKDLFEKSYLELISNYKPYINGEITEEEWERMTDERWQKLWPSESKELATAVEVLRQAGYTDWKLYSRYHDNGVADLWVKEVGKEKYWGEYDVNKHPTKSKYLFGEVEAMKICYALGFTYWYNNF